MSEAPHVIEVAIEPKSSGDSARLEQALRAIVGNRSDLSVSVDQESGQHLLCGIDEHSLNAVVGHLKENSAVEFNVGAPSVVYRETLSRAATIRYTHKKIHGPMGQFADVTIAFEPLPSGSGVVFENDSTQFPAEFIPAIEKGLRAQAQSGLLAGFPLIDFKARLIDVRHHEVDSSPFAFDIAARAAFRELAQKNVAVLLEPVMKVEVTTPDDFLGGIIGDLNSRKGRVLDTASHGGEMQAIAAIVPLAAMLGYRVTLDAMTEGRGRYKMAFDHYERVHVDGGGDDTFPAAMALRA